MEFVVVIKENTTYSFLEVMGSENQQQFEENLLHNHNHQEQQQQQRKNRSLRSKAAHFVSDVATVILNPISDKPLKPRPPPLPVSFGGS